uniref:DnaJ homolog subfamily C member 30, mitochondrial n=1 Tax=Oryzias melastigma TaxID=30732 RepID=A0A3B3DAA6_ORYME
MRVHPLVVNLRGGVGVAVAVPGDLPRPPNEVVAHGLPPDAGLRLAHAQHALVHAVQVGFGLQLALHPAVPALHHVQDVQHEQERQRDVDVAVRARAVVVDHGGSPDPHPRRPPQGGQGGRERGGESRVEADLGDPGQLTPGHGAQAAVHQHGDSNGSRAEPLHKTKTGYYEVLQVTPVATQAQIKTAYYKQSFIYHPDRNAGSDDATARFSEISEAYTVLGNKALRRKYDRGLLSAADLTAAVRPSARDTPGSSAKSGDSRHSVGRTGTQGGTFDFDKFYKSHYNEQLQRQQEIRVRKEEMQKTDAVGDKKLGLMVEVAIVMLLIFAFGLIQNINKG